MKVFIDTEFNGYRGELISIALVPQEGPEFYRVLQCENPVPWVAEHVMPFLGQKWIGRYQLQIELQAYLLQFHALTIIADWPDDLRYFCELLITGPGERIKCPRIDMQIRERIDSSKSAVPHNALHDARAIKESYWLWLSRLPKGVPADFPDGQD